MWDTKWTFCCCVILDVKYFYILASEKADKVVFCTGEIMRSKLLVAAACRYVHPAVDIAKTMGNPPPFLHIMGTANLDQFFAS